MSYLWTPAGDKIHFADDLHQGEQFATRAKRGDFMGSLNTLPDPDPVLKRMPGKGISILRDLLADGHLESVWSVRCSTVSGASWELTPGGDGADEKKACELYQALLDNLDMPRVINEMMEAVAFGNSPIEIIWDTDGKYWIFENLVGKPTEWFIFTKENELALRKGFFDHEVVPPHRFLLTRHKSSYSNPYGVRQFSKCFWPVTFRKNGWKWWTMFIEKFGGAFLYGQYPTSASQKQKNDLLDALDKMVGDAVAIAPENTKITIHESTAKGQTGNAHKEYNTAASSEISKTVLGQTLTTDIPQKYGSNAAAKTHDRVRGDLTRSDMGMITSSFNRLGKKITVFNFGVNVKPPKFQYKKAKELKTDQAERDTKLYAVGVRFQPAYISHEYQIPEEQFEIQSNDDNNSKKSFQHMFKKFFKEEIKKLFAKKREKKRISLFKKLISLFKRKKKQPGLKEVEEFSREKEADGQKALNTIIENFSEKIKTASTYEEAFEIIAGAYPEIDYSQLAGIIDEIRYTASQIGGDGERR